MIFALAGNQNCGKTTLFNQLTGSNQHVGNFPGVTVDKKEGVVPGPQGGKASVRPPPRSFCTTCGGAAGSGDCSGSARHLFAFSLYQ